MIALANAKINLYLAIKGIRSDGFHEIQTVFQEISLTDKLTLKKTETPGIKLFLRAPSLSSVGPVHQNTIVKAYNFISQITGCKKGVIATLVKNIPAGAGLGGGSSDAAAFINSYDRLYSLGIPEKTKIEIASRVGADTPFFLRGGCAAGFGKGEVLRPIDSRSKLWFVVVYPGIHVNTRKAYELYDKSCRPPIKRVSKLLTISKNINNINHYLKTSKPSFLRGILGNDFENAVTAYYPGIGPVLSELRSCSEAVYSGLSGSGSACFSMFDSRVPAQRLYRKICRRQGWHVRLAESIQE